MDSRLCFHNINHSWPGRVHDMQVLTNTALYQNVQIGSLVTHVKRQTSGIQIPTVVSGDPVYSQKPWLLTPHKNTSNLSRKQLSFNNKLSATRMAMENSFCCCLKAMHEITPPYSYKLLFALQTMIRRLCLA